MFKKLALAAVLMTGGAALVPMDWAAAQLTPAPAGIKRTILQKTEVAGTNTEVVVGMVEIPAAFKVGRHTHPGSVSAHVAEGELFVTLDGQPEKQYKTGEYAMIPPGAIHDERSGDKPVKLITIYVVEKGKPLATLVK